MPIAAKSLSCLLRCLVSATVLFAAAAGASSQEAKAQWLPRDEMIGAIIGFAASRCGQPDGVLPELFEAYCKDRSSELVVHMTARTVLGSQSDEALRELCRKHRISECQTQEETSRGQQLLVLDRTIATTGSAMTSTWSPDNRFLLLDLARGRWEASLLDLASGQLLDKAIAKSGLEATAWSSDGKYLAVISGDRTIDGQMPPLGGIRVLSIASLGEVGAFPASRKGCDFRLGRKLLAFTADSKFLWVGCFARDTSSPAMIKLKIPKLEIEDELRLSPPPGVLQAHFSPQTISREANDLILSGSFHPRKQSGMASIDGAVAAFSLTKKSPIYPSFFPGSPFVIIRHTEDSSLVFLYSAKGGTPDYSRGGAPIDWKIEVWDTRSQKRVSTFGGATDAGTLTTSLVSIPQSNVLVRAFGPRSSSRMTLIVIDDRTGTVLQELGPFRTRGGVVVSPDGSSVAVFGFNDIRIYKVNRRSDG
jgi:WD40 repeat protein